MQRPSMRDQLAQLCPQKPQPCKALKGMAKAKHRKPKMWEGLSDALQAQQRSRMTRGHTYGKANKRARDPINKPNPDNRVYLIKREKWDTTPNRF